MNEVVLEAGDRLRVRFTRRGDRWGHAVEALSDVADGATEGASEQQFDARGGQQLWQLESIEAWEAGSAMNDTWPPSPALQSLQVLEVGSRRVVLLVGMAGASHWSASVEADPIARRISFDVACRLTQPPTWLGSRYRRADGKLAAIREGSRESVAGSQPQVVLAESTATDAFEPTVETSDEEILIRVATQALALPMTARWNYFVSE